MRGPVVESLGLTAAEQRSPVGGYVAIADEWRATRATLLDSMSAGLKLNSVLNEALRPTGDPSEGASG